MLLCFIFWLGLCVVPMHYVILVCYVILVSCAPGILLLSQFDRSWLGPNGNPMLVQRIHQNVPHVFVVRIKVKDVSHRVGQSFVGKFLVKKKRRGKKINVCWKDKKSWKNIEVEIGNWLKKERDKREDKLLSGIKERLKKVVKEQFYKTI